VLDEDKYATFAVAHELHMTVAELGRRMSHHEFVHWIAYLNERTRRAEQARER